ncbi:hypothetical protein ABW20_dc0108871 [Dactylellina cionopaga]|nr:hypothetical protein ABW20_dc0108871 [Dactylellina cionopaga]
MRLQNCLASAGPALLILLANLPALTNAWGFRLIPDPDDKSRANESRKVHTGIKSCASISLRPGQKLNGIEITQYNPFLGNVLNLSAEGWERPVRYIGFWKNKRCEGLPVIIAHFYTDANTKQKVVFTGISDRVQFDKNTKLWSWGEIPDGGKLWPGGVIPEGALAVRHGDPMINVDEAEFWILENSITVTEADNKKRAREEWKGFGSGSNDPIKSVTLSGKQLTMTNEELKNDNGEIQLLENLSKAKLQMKGQTVDNPISIPGVPGIPGPRHRASMEDTTSLVDFLEKEQEVRGKKWKPHEDATIEFLEEQLNAQQGQNMNADQDFQDYIEQQAQPVDDRQRMQNELGMQQAAYQSFEQQRAAQLNQQFVNNFVESFAQNFGQQMQNRLRMDPRMYFKPNYMADVQNTLWQLGYYWEQQLGLPLDLLMSMLSNLPSLIFHELLDDMGGKLSLQEIAQFLLQRNLIHMQDILAYQQGVSGPDQQSNAMLEQYYMQLKDQFGLRAGGTENQPVVVEDGIEIENEDGYAETAPGFPNVGLNTELGQEAEDAGLANQNAQAPTTNTNNNLNYYGSLSDVMNIEHGVDTDGFMQVPFPSPMNPTNQDLTAASEDYLSLIRNYPSLVGQLAMPSGQENTNEP